MQETKHGAAQQKQPREEIWLNREEMLVSKRSYWFFRRLQDIVFSTAALLLLWPLMLVVAMLIMLDDPRGGPIYAQKRVGRDGKIFHLYKFRSMHMDAERQADEELERSQSGAPMFLIGKDPRVTAVGRFIRRTSIDELPQLFNILKGDMSFVGPRPALPREVAFYSPYQRQRLFVQPGLTGLWQIHPNRNEMSFEDWIDLDLTYARDRSFLLDCKIILMTFRAVLGGQGV